jgi:hypothetical protein
VSSPAAGDKSIKFSIGISQDSVDNAKRAIRSINDEVTRLVENTKRAGGLFGGASVGNSFAQPGMSGRQNAQNKASGPAGSLTDGLTRAVQNSAQLFKGAAAGSKDAFKIMSDGIKDHVRTADTEISKLEQKLGKLGNAYGKLKDKGGNLADNAAGAVRGQFFQTADQLDRARSSRAKLVKAQEDMEEVNSPSIMGRIRNYFSNGKSGGGGGGLFGAAMQGAGLGGIGTALASPAGAVAGGVMLGSKIMNLGRDNQISNIGMAIDANMFRSDSRASIGGLYGGNAQAIAGGDMARVHATRMMQNDPAFKNVVSAEYSKLLKERRLVEGVPGGLGGMVGIGMQYLGSAANSVGLTSSAGVGSAITAQNDYLRRSATEAALQTQTAQRMIENKMREDPAYSDRLNAMYAGSTSSAGMLRSIGMGGGNVRVGGRNGHDLEQAGYIQARADAQMRDVGEYGAAFSALSGSAGRGLAGHYESVLGPQTGGLSNVAQILGLGAQFGGGGWNGASAFLGRGNNARGRGGYGVQGMIGRGGTDVSAAVGLTGIGGGMMNSGALLEGGGGVMETLLAAGYTGTAGGDMRMSNAMAGGVAAQTRMMNGSIDPLQQALNASAAMKAAKDAPYGAKWAMMHMDPAQKAEFQRTGRVPSDMLGMGVTDKMLKSFLSLQTGGMFSRVSSSMVGGKAGAELAKFKKSGNNFEYLRGKSLDEIQNSAKLLAPVLHMAGGADTNAAALTSIRFSLASSKILTGGKGHGAHDTMRRNTAQAVAAGAKAELGVQTAAKNADESEAQKADFVDAPKQRNSNDSARNKALKALGPGADVQGSIEAVSAALNAFVNAIKRDMSPTGKAGAPR